MEKNVLILEDNEDALEMLHKILNELNRKVKIYTASSLRQAYIQAMQTTMDVFLVDIILDTKEKGDVSGMIFAEKIREVEKYAFTPIIFTTCLEDPKLHAFTSIHSFAYLEKPYSHQEMKKVLSQALNFTTERYQDRRLYFRKEGVVLSVKSEDIISIESNCHRLYIQTKEETLEMPYKTCKQLMQEMDCDDFIQCSRSIIINKRYIDSVDIANRYITLQDSYGQAEIGVTYMKKVMEGLGVGQ